MYLIYIQLLPGTVGKMPKDIFRPLFYPIGGLSTILVKVPPCLAAFQVGQKYGYRPLPASLPSSHFEPMIDGLASLNLGDGVTLLKKWFHKDLNCVPPLYVLQPISSILPNFLNSRKVKLQQADQEEWFKTMQELHKYVLKGTELLKHNNIIPENEYLKFRMSVLEREFTKGILEAADTKEDCLAFTRLFFSH